MPTTMSAAGQLTAAGSHSGEALQPLLGLTRDTRVEIHCAFCGYGGVVNHLPDRCPMCGLHAWDQGRH
jgi:rubrerythrin